MGRATHRPPPRRPRRPRAAARQGRMRLVAHAARRARAGRSKRACASALHDAKQHRRRARYAPECLIATRKRARVALCSSVRQRAAVHPNGRSARSGESTRLYCPRRAHCMRVRMNRLQGKQPCAPASACGYAVQNCLQAHAPAPRETPTPPPAALTEDVAAHPHAADARAAGMCAAYSAARSRACECARPTRHAARHSARACVCVFTAAPAASKRATTSL
jgi:hypothetical protein